MKFLRKIKHKREIQKRIDCLEPYRHVWKVVDSSDDPFPYRRGLFKKILIASNGFKILVLPCNELDSWPRYGYWSGYPNERTIDVLRSDYFYLEDSMYLTKYGIELDFKKQEMHYSADLDLKINKEMKDYLLFIIKRVGRILKRESYEEELKNLEEELENT